MAKANYCRRGHAWVPANTYYYRDHANRLRRKCKQCTLDRAASCRASYPRKKASDDFDYKNRDAKECIRVNRVISLIDRYDQAQTSWERADIKAEIRALEKSQ